MENDWRFSQAESGLGPWGLLKGTYINVPLGDSKDKYSPSDAPEDRGRNLLYNGPDEADRWENLVEVAKDLSNQYTYKAFPDVLPDTITSVWGPALNSNSFIKSVMYYSGFDIANSQPNPPNYVPDFFIGTPTRLGTQGDDDLTPDSNTTALFGGTGADTLISTSSSNTSSPYDLVAGRDDDVDTLHAGSGADVLVGHYTAIGSNSDWMNGGEGIDVVDLSGLSSGQTRRHPLVHTRTCRTSDSRSVPV